MGAQATGVAEARDQAVTRFGAAVDEVLQAGLLDAETLERLGDALVDTLNRMGAAFGALPAGGSGLSESEVGALRSSGINPGDADLREDARSALAGAIADYTRLAATALPTAQAAQRAGLSEGRIRQLVSSGELLGIKVRGDLRIPLFQFGEEDGLLPSLNRVMRHLDLRLLHPVAVERWFVLPRDELDGRSVRTWLLAGHDPEVAARVARHAATLA